MVMDKGVAERAPLIRDGGAWTISHGLRAEHREVVRVGGVDGRRARVASLGHLEARRGTAKPRRIEGAGTEDVAGRPVKDRSNPVGDHAHGLAINAYVSRDAALQEALVKADGRQPFQHRLRVAGLHQFQPLAHLQADGVGDVDHAAKAGAIVGGRFVALDLLFL